MCRQLIDPAEWDEHDGPSLGDRMEWSNRACGMAVLRMILLAYGQDAPTLTQLLHLGSHRGGLIDRGWVHSSIAELATDLGVPARAEAVDIEDIPIRLADAPMVISVTEKLPDDGRRGGHLIIVRGCEDDTPPTLLFRDPSGWGQTHSRASLRRVAASYSGRAITFTPLTRERLP
jgi:hypothetical protein